MKISRYHSYRMAAFGLAGLLAIAGCHGGSNNSQNSEGAVTAGSDSTTAPTEDANGVIHFSQETPGVLQPGQAVFGSPEEAVGVFRDAVAAKDRRTLIGLFGNQGSVLIFSGDRIQENRDLQSFNDRLNEYTHIDRPSDTVAILYAGKENWPFPIPLIKSPAGWFFDVVAGRDELLNRRIGDDELTAISVCQAYVEAQKEYARKDRMGDGMLQYAQHFISASDKKDGLYWVAGSGEELSPMGPLVAEAQLEGYPATRPTDHKPHPFHGYIFHILKAQGAAAPGGEMSYLVNDKMVHGFALVAYPSAYGASGVMTFIVAKDGKVYQKNLGDNTSDTVKAMTEYNPDKTWDLVKPNDVQ